MDNSDSHVEETQFVEANQYDIHHEEHLESSSQSIHTKGHKRGKWVVKIIYPDGNIKERRLHQFDVGRVLLEVDPNRNIIAELLHMDDLDKLHGGRVILEFERHYNQPEGDSGGLFGRWLGRYCDTFPLGITYEDWRKIDKLEKDKCWNEIQKKFYFDASNENYKKVVMKHFSQRYKGAKNRLWQRYQDKTPEEAMEDWPKDIRDFISKEEWQDFVKLRFSEKAKKLREQNIKVRSHYKTPHTLGTKSITRLSEEIFIETGKCPSRKEVLERRQKKTPSAFVIEEARDLSAKLMEKMTQNTGNRSENNPTSSMRDDEFYEVCAGERHGRVRCVGLGPTPSTFFKNRSASTSTKNEAKDLKNENEQMKALSKLFMYQLEKAFWSSNWN